MKVVFLDFDGVLNNSTHINKVVDELDDLAHRGISTASLTSYAKHLDPQAVLLLNQILDASGAVVVVSSAWRFAHSMGDLQRLLNLRGFTGRVIDTTPALRGTSRGTEILMWLDGHPDVVESFVILDDDDDMSGLEEYLVLTSSLTGLTEQDVVLALEVLG